MDAIKAAKKIWKNFRLENVFLREKQNNSSQPKTFESILRQEEDKLKNNKLKRELKTEPTLTVDKNGNNVIAHATVPMATDIRHAKSMLERLQD